MADVDFDDFDGGYGAPNERHVQVSRLINLAGATCSVALVVTLGLWGYKLAVRDVQGIPVIRAMEGPMRIAPENPGGEVAAHQGLAVNAIAAVGTSASMPERLVLAPRPVELTFEDAPGISALSDGGQADAAVAQMPVAAPQPVPVEVGDSRTLDPAALIVPDDVLAAADTLAVPDADAVANALAEALAGDIGDDTVQLASLNEPVAEPVAASVGLRPKARPASLVRAVAEPVAAPAAEPVAAETPAEVEASTIPAGTRLVQLGAFDTADQARTEWAVLSSKFGSEIAGKSLVVQQAESGGRTFYRLRALGFADEAAARDFCTALLEKNAACILVIVR
jgi:hypothetical protein